MKNRLIVKHALIASSIIAAIFAQQAMATGFQINEMSPSLQGTATAGAAAATNDPSAMAYNPATLATIQGTQVQLAASYIMPHVSYENAAGTGTGSLTSQSSIAPADLVPAGYFAAALPDGFFEGIAVTAPWGLSTQYDPTWVGSPNAVKSSIETTDIAPTIAYRVNDYLAIGAAVHAQYANVEYSSANDFIVPESEDLTGNSWGVGYSAGVLVTPREGTNIGLSYRSKITQNIQGTADTVVGSLNVPTSASAQVTMPEVVNLGLSQEITSKLTGLATAQWTRWDRMQSLVITTPLGDETNVLDWKNSWLFALGAEYQLTEQLVLRAGGAFDESPTQDTYRDPRIPDSNRYWLTTGVGYTPIQNLTLNFVYEHIFMMPQSVNLAGNQPVSAFYHGSADILGTSANWTF
jgi:long-chain fatty acid transport protein